jgi:hypothetical protein
LGIDQNHQNDDGWSTNTDQAFILGADWQEL